MSGRSPTNNFLTAGIIGVGVGVLAAGVGYAIATNSPTCCSPQPSERRMGRLLNVCDREDTTENYNANACPKSDQCKICGKHITSEPSASLSCNHTFHRKCLFSSYVVQTQVNKGNSFRCPFEACQVEIPEHFLESLIAMH